MTKYNETYTINSNAICGEAYNEALREVAEIVNETLGTSYRRDWVQLEVLADKLGIRFNENGEIVRA